MCVLLQSVDKSVQAVQAACWICIIVQYIHKSVGPVQTGTEVCELVVSVAEKGCFADVASTLTLRTLCSCSTNSHSLSDSSRSLIPSSCHCVTRSIAFWCVKAYSSKSNNEFHRVATSLGMQVTFIRRSFKISRQAGRTRVVKWIILKESLRSWTD